MKIGILKAEPNKWQYGIAWGKVPPWQGGHDWFIKLHSIPEPGKMISRENYRGFRFCKTFS